MTNGNTNIGSIDCKVHLIAWQVPKLYKSPKHAKEISADSLKHLTGVWQDEKHEYNKPGSRNINPHWIVKADLVIGIGEPVTSRYYLEGSRARVYVVLGTWEQLWWVDDRVLL